MIFSASNAEDDRWFCEKTSYIPSPSFKGILCSENGVRLGMIGLDFWTPRSVQAHIVIDNAKSLAPLRREVLGYLWKHGRRLLYAVTPSNNEKSLKLQIALGFEERYRLKDAWDEGVDMVIMELPIREPVQ